MFAHSVYNRLVQPTVEPIAVDLSMLPTDFEWLHTAFLDLKTLQLIQDRDE